MKIDVFRNIFFFLTLAAATAMQRKQQQQNSFIKSWAEKDLEQLCLNHKLPSLKFNLVVCVCVCVCVCTRVHTHVCLHKSVPAIQHELSFFQKWFGLFTL